MKVVHIQAAMTPAGNAAYRLCTAMRDNGIDSTVLNLSPSANKDHAYNYNRYSILSRGIDKIVRSFRKINYRKDSYFYTSTPLFGRNISKHELVINSDIIYIHWTAGFLSRSNIEDLANLGKPIFMFMHDMWPFTGGCHHSMECSGYTVDCKRCKMFTRKNHSVNHQLLSKAKTYSKYDNIYFISPSNWMADCARKSFPLREKLVFVIPNIVDEKVFKPLNKEVVRDILNLPQDKTIITFGCQAGQKNPFKGWDYLEKAINQISRDNILIMIYGSGYSQETVDKVKYPIKFMGWVNDETLLALICNAADLFVTPSLCENYSLVVLENVLCKTPVVGFNTTGVPELVITDDTGYLAKFKDSEDLARGIEYVIDNKMPFNFKKKYSSKGIIEQHKKLIDKAIHHEL